MRIKRGVPKKDDTVRLPIAPDGSGDWIEIKKMLTAGERGDVLDYSIRAVTQAKPGSGEMPKMEIDYGKQAYAAAAACITNWNFVDHDEAPIAYIRGGTLEARIAQIRALDEPTVKAINEAIEAYEKGLEGNAPPSGTPAAPAGGETSPSPM